MKFDWQHRLYSVILSDEKSRAGPNLMLRLKRPGFSEVSAALASSPLKGSLLSGWWHVGKPRGLSDS